MAGHLRLSHVLKALKPRDIHLRAFWLFQLFFWSAVFAWRTGYTFAYGYGFAGAGLRAVSLLAAIALTLGFGHLIVRIARDRLEFTNLVAIAALGSVLAIAHTIGDRLLYVSARNDWQLTLPPLEEFLQIFSVNAWVFLSWTGFFLVILQFSRLRDRENAIQRLRQSAKDARLQTLMHQFNPHFLFNALNSISALIASGRAADADRMLLKMSRFLRRAIDANHEQKSRLDDELSMVRDYLDIQKVRFEDRLDYAFDVPITCGDLLVPALILQPLVENALEHGLEPDTGRCDLLIKARLTDGQLRISVCDRGPGFATTRPVCDGAGLRLIRERLDVHYADRAGLAFHQREGGGGVVAIELIAERDDQSTSRWVA